MRMHYSSFKGPLSHLNFLEDCYKFITIYSQVEVGPNLIADPDMKTLIKRLKKRKKKKNSKSFS